MHIQENDDQLWKLAKKRAAFKYQLLAYIFTNIFLTAVWFFTAGINSYFWPFWIVFGWGFSLAFQYADCYHRDNIYSAQTEYQKLKKQNLQ